MKWYTDYNIGMQYAFHNQKRVLIYFCEDYLSITKDHLYQKFKEKQIRQLLNDYVLIRIPMSTEFFTEDESIRLINHYAYSELFGQSGIAIVDFENRNNKYYEEVISIYPLNLRGALSDKNLTTLFTLPYGSLTQRTLIFFIRIHPEQPQSTKGICSDFLMSEAENHSIDQAMLNLQGHHYWNKRFRYINSKFPGCIASEICAQSWPNKGLIDGAIDIVASWRLSSGHWKSAYNFHRYYGYDMKSGKNNIWYATGIFVDG
jgi:hypothetical protein